MDVPFESGSGPCFEIISLLASRQFGAAAAGLTSEELDSNGLSLAGVDELLQTGFIVKENREFFLVLDKFMELYIKHLKRYIQPDVQSNLFQSEVDERNKARKKIARDFENFFSDQQLRAVLGEIVVQALKAARGNLKLENIGEVFMFADRLVENTSRAIEGRMWQDKRLNGNNDIRDRLRTLALSVDYSATYLQPVFEKMMSLENLFEAGKFSPEIREKLTGFCKNHQIKKLSLFGSAIDERFSPLSDIDVLVEFESESVPGLFDINAMERELENFFGRPVDLRTPNDLAPRIKERVLKEARVLYEEE